MENIKSLEQWKISNEENSSLFNAINLTKHSEWITDFSHLDLTKPGILIIDDNEGICSFIEDDFEELHDEGNINLSDYNVFIFSGRMCAYDILASITTNENLNIQKAIIDITYGGTFITDSGNIKLNGVDVFEVLYEINPDLKYLFYTGNQMNFHIKTIGAIMRKYTSITQKNITDSILFKTQFNMNDRREYILDNLFEPQI